MDEQAQWLAEVRRDVEQAQVAERAGQLAQAYALLRRAHDAVVDCPRLHQHVHRQLLRLNRRRGAYREMAIDALLLMTAPFGSFELVARFMKGHVLGGEICRRA